MKNLKFATMFAIGAALALSPAHVAAQAAGKQVSFGAQIQAKPDGPEIAALLPDRTAAMIGFKVGDILLEVGGQPVSREAFGAYMNGKKEGDVLSFKVRRAGAVVELSGKAVSAPEGTPAPATQP